MVHNIIWVYLCFVLSLNNHKCIFFLKNALLRESAQLQSIGKSIDQGPRLGLELSPPPPPPSGQVSISVDLTYISRQPRHPYSLK